MTRSISIGCGSAWSDDRLDWGQELADSGYVTYMGLTALRTDYGLAQIRRRNDETRVRTNEFLNLWTVSLTTSPRGEGVGNFGAANPSAAPMTCCEDFLK
ncbi:hypothetical protein CM1200mP19_0790 [bacterium]|nr:MAG: hypothetical protein CM1200mP19_0790 [bacterium]